MLVLMSLRKIIFGSALAMAIGALVLAGGIGEPAADEHGYSNVSSPTLAAGDAIPAPEGRKVLTVSGNIAVAQNVIVGNHHVAEIDADAKAHAAFFRQIDIARRDAFLHGERAAHRLDRARELRQHAVAAGGDDAPALLRDAAVDRLAAGAQRVKGAFLVVAHQLAVSHHVGGKNGGQTAFDDVSCQALRSQISE